MATTNSIKSKHIKGNLKSSIKRKFLGFFQKNSVVVLLNNTSVYMFPHIQNETLEKECIWVRIRGVLLAIEGAPKLCFHREWGGKYPHLPLKSATAPSNSTKAVRGTHDEGVVAHWCNPLTLRPDQSGGVGSIPGRTLALERYDKGPRTR